VAVVLAAGRASRLSARTGGASNVTLQLGGMSLMERSVRVLLRSGVERVVVVLGHGADAVERCLDGFPSERVETARAELAAGEQRLPDGGGSLRGQ
jgi:choline kinase